jgi:3-deoxy-7-phosphoheptulonate synthase
MTDGASRLKKTSDLRISFIDPLISPVELKKLLPLPEGSAATVVDSRRVIQAVLARKDSRLLAVVGPCSIHDYGVAIEYANRLRDLSERVKDRIYILMRVYFEKPRTTIGWRGLIVDPRLDGTYQISEGLTLARRLLIEITGMGLPAATEMLDPIVPQYVDDLISWAAIGARTTESQTHRNMVSGLSMPVGFKNGTDGNLQIAIDAMASARHPHHFIGIDQEGKTSVLGTKGNKDTHIILRGSRTGTNFKKPEIVYTAELLKEAGFLPAIMVDCSHGNSDKRAERQEEVLRSLLQSRASGCREVIGFMMESNLFGGRQDIPRDPSRLRYGISITDPCLSWEQTERLLLYAYEQHAAGD